MFDASYLITNLFLFIFLVNCICSFLLLYKLTEQCTAERQDTQAIGGEISDLDTKVTESSEEAAQSVSLSFVDNVTEMVVGDSFPTEAASDLGSEAVSVVEGEG